VLFYHKQFFKILGLYWTGLSYPYGTGTIIAIVFRASTSKSSEGWFFVRRIIRPRERSTIRPGNLMNENRIAFIRLLLQDSPSAILFIIAFRLYASIMIHHHVAFSQKSPEGNFPPANWWKTFSK